jgi:hypothetical protein
MLSSGGVTNLEESDVLAPHLGFTIGCFNFNPKESKRERERERVRESESEKERNRALE